MKLSKHRFSSKAPLLWGAVLLFVVNLLALDYIVLQKLPNSPTVLGESTAANACPVGCLSAINKLGGSSLASAKEFYIPFGSGSNNSDDWESVGAEAQIDTRQYQRIKKVVFEATVQVPTGNQYAFVRLFNATDKHPVWYSEVSMNGTGPTVLTSSPITLDTGNKLYVVQMKTQLMFTANLLQSRVHITTY